MSLDSTLDGTPAVPDEFAYTTTLPVRYRDTDTMGHVNNAVYVTYFEQARIDYFDAVLDIPLEEREMVLANLEMDYRRSVTTDDEYVTVAVRTPSLGTRSFPTVCEMYTPDGDLAAEGSSTLVVVDGEGGTRPIPDAWREALVAFEPALDEA
ncbi:acyl-CoA thioesterase [Haloglomus halophilum]|uniref:acyl-CoA thioesterase n=1 Tax=Haloglomus halophilum TaxID=2962672 RepID=UPI0020C96E42|nr:thioesterase family protein [Haloglomus halophilum]